MLSIHNIGSDIHRADLHELESRGLSIPHHYRTLDSKTGVWCRISSADRVQTAFVLHIGRSRAVPGSKILRIERFGRELHDGIADTVGPIMKELQSRFRFVLRFNIALFDEDAGRRTHMRTQLEQVGFHATASRNYIETLRLPLSGNADEVFSQLTYSARRGIRASVRSGLRVCRIDSSTYVARMKELYLESFRRTGSVPAPVDFHTILESARVSETSALIGAFLPEATEPSHLVAFAWVRSHGDHATYDIGASTRSPVLGNASVGHAVLWDCIVWAIQHGHQWFDLGGVISESAPQDHPLTGISTFKKGFSKTRLMVSDELAFEPNPTLAALAAKSERLLNLLMGTNQPHRTEIK